MLASQQVTSTLPHDLQSHPKTLYHVRLAERIVEEAPSTGDLRTRSSSRLVLATISTTQCCKPTSHGAKGMCHLDPISEPV